MNERSPIYYAQCMSENDLKTPAIRQQPKCPDFPHFYEGQMVLYTPRIRFGIQQKTIKAKIYKLYPSGQALLELSHGMKKPVRCGSLKVADEG